MNTDYTVRNAQRAPDGRVTYTVCDRNGHVRSVTVPYHLSTPELADPVIRNAIANTQLTKVGRR